MNGIDVVRNAVVSNQKKNLKYKRLRYITFTGTQYIDTEVIPDDTTEMIISFKTLVQTTGFIAGSRIAYQKNAFSLADDFSNNAGILFQYDNRSMTSRLYNSEFGTYNVAYLAKNNSTLNAKDIRVDFTTTLVSELSVYIGALHLPSDTIDSRTFKGNIYDCKFIKNGEIIKHFIPVVYQTGEIGFQELIEDKLYLNNGTGELIAGPDHNGQTYIPLEYISSTGAGEYIDTNITGISNLSFELEAAFNSTISNYQFAAGILDVGRLRIAPLLLDIGSDTPSYCKTTDLNIQPYTDIGDTDFHTYIFNEVGTGNIKFDGNIIDQYVAPETPVTSILSIVLFARRTSTITIETPANIKIKKFKVWDNIGRLILSYQPVYHVDSDRIGMYNTITNTMMINSGKGAFIPGPELSYTINDLL